MAGLERGGENKGKREARDEERVTCNMHSLPYPVPICQTHLWFSLGTFFCPLATICSFP